MRTQAEMLSDKVTDEDVDDLIPYKCKVHNYGGNAVEVHLETQTNKAMKKGFKGKLTLERGGKKLVAIIDRDELIMFLGNEPRRSDPPRR